MHPKKTYIDPPSGWMYGFPQPLDGVRTVTQILLDAGYPEDQIEFACQHMRFIYPVDEEPND